MSRPNFDGLMKHLRDETKTSPRMVQSMVELTYGCNLRCVHCYNPTHEAKNELSTEEVFRILDQLSAQGVLWVGFTGGELFTRKDAVEIFRYAKQKGFVISLLTNATLITPERAEQIAALEPFFVEVSVYGATAETYERVTQVPGSFQKFVRGVDLLLEHKAPVMLKIILMTLNVHEFEAMREFCKTRKVRFKVGTDIHPRVDGSKEPLAYRLSPEQTFDIWKKISGEGVRQNLRSGAFEVPKEEDSCGQLGKLFECGCGKSNAAITPYGKMNLCLGVYTPGYDLKEGSIEEGWANLVELVRSQKPGPDYECNHCDVAKHCTRGINNSWLEQRVFDAPCIDHFKEVAEQKAQFLAAD